MVEDLPMMRNQREEATMDGSNGSRWHAAGICGLLVFALVLALGCGRDAQESTAGQNMPTSKAKEEVSQAASGAAESVGTQRRRIEEQAEETRDAMERELTDARRELAALPSESRGALQAAIDRGESAQNALAREIEDAQRPSAEPWEKREEQLAAASDQAEAVRREIAALLAGYETKTSEP